MFELISQIPFHFTTSLCPLMDPIYYIYHKLYHISGDHVGHCHQARLRARLCARGEMSATRSSLQMHFFLSFTANQNYSEWAREGAAAPPWWRRICRCWFFHGQHACARKTAHGRWGNWEKMNCCAAGLLNDWNLPHFSSPCCVLVPHVSVCDILAVIYIQRLRLIIQRKPRL